MGSDTVMPGSGMSPARADYYIEVLRIEWLSMTPRQREKVRRASILLHAAMQAMTREGR